MTPKTPPMTRVTITKSDRDGKKLKAVFVQADGTRKTVHFGAAGMSDFTIHKDADRKQRYLARHAANESWSSPMTAGSLSRWVLWNKPTLAASIVDFKRRFRLG